MNCGDLRCLGLPAWLWLRLLMALCNVANVSWVGFIPWRWMFCPNLYPTYRLSLWRLSDWLKLFKVRYQGVLFTNSRWVPCCSTKAGVWSLRSKAVCSCRVRSTALQRLGRVDRYRGAWWQSVVPSNVLQRNVIIIVNLLSTDVRTMYYKSIRGRSSVRWFRSC